VISGAIIGAYLMGATVTAQEQHAHAPSPPATGEGWQWNLDGSVVFGFNYQYRKFRDFSAWESQNWLMAGGARQVRAGTFQMTTMLSLEPWSIADIGSPQAFQTGETFRRAPLIDYQHPHDLIMALGAVYRRPWSRGTWALAAAAVGFALELDAETVRRGLEAVRPAAMRGVVHRLRDGIVVLDDSYNSNPAAMDRAIEMLRGATARGRRVLVSGDMLELGTYGATAHTRLGGQAAAAGIDLFVAVGPLSRRAFDAARAAGCESWHFDDSEKAASWVAAEIRPGDLILVKGSRGARMERVVQAIQAALGADEAGGGH